jgi:hypothetical protein
VLVPEQLVRRAGELERYAATLRRKRIVQGCTCAFGKDRRARIEELVAELEEAARHTRQTADRLIDQRVSVPNGCEPRAPERRSA